MGKSSSKERRPLRPAEERKPRSRFSVEEEASVLGVRPPKALEVISKKTMYRTFEQQSGIECRDNLSFFFVEHLVRPADTLMGMNIRYGIPLSKLKRDNGIPDSSNQFFHLSSLLLQCKGFAYALYKAAPELEEILDTEGMRPGAMIKPPEELDYHDYTGIPSPLSKSVQSSSTEESPRNGSIRGHLEVSPSPGLLQELTDARRQHSKSHRRTKGGRRKSRGQKPESRQGENGGSEFDSPSGRGVRHLKVSSQGSTVLFSGSYDQSPSPPRLRVPSGEGDGIPASSDESSISGGSSPEREVSPHRSHRLAVPDSGMPAPSGGLSLGSPEDPPEILYDDLFLCCTSEGLLVKQFYWHDSSPKFLPFEKIEAVDIVKSTHIKSRVTIAARLFLMLFQEEIWEGSIVEVEQTSSRSTDAPQSNPPVELIVVQEHGSPLPVAVLAQDVRRVFQLLRECSRLLL